MSETYACTFVNCDKVFSKAFELKKHKVTHEAPNRVFYCHDCDFYTLQKKNLRIHIATHTGEKTYQCPDMISDDDSPEASQDRCEYRTNDPAALTKHRKKAHGYIPPTNRSRHAKVAPHKPHQKNKKDGKASYRTPPSPYPYPAPTSCRRSKPPRVLRPAYSPIGGAGYASTSTESSKESSPFSWEGNTRSMDSDSTDASECETSSRSGAFGKSTALNTFESAAHDSSPFLWQGPVDAYVRQSVDPRPDPSAFSGFVSPYGHFESYDASLHPWWMAKYELGYSSFEATGLRYQPEPMPEVRAQPIFSIPIPGAGCLCPEWMVDSGVEGWDRQALKAYKEFYTL